MPVSSQQLLKRARGVAFLLLDVDGVLTDGKVTFTSEGHEVKSFDIQDGHGLKQLARAGVGIGLLSGRNSPIVDWRATLWATVASSPTVQPTRRTLGPSRQRDPTLVPASRKVRGASTVSCPTSTSAST